MRGSLHFMARSLTEHLRNRCSGLSSRSTEPSIAWNPCDRDGSLAVSSLVWLWVGLIRSATVRSAAGLPCAGSGLTCGVSSDFIGGIVMDAEAGVGRVDRVVL